ncbi:MAG: DUF3429 domain-containing protein [Alphaproteobacteria bacterium]|nr:DUF3429 domain-containing protein [Alphaproteobacteria bacterium]
MEATRPAVPKVAGLLGILGLIPFAVPVLGALVAAPAWHDVLARALLAYGAVILSFLGGVQWGLAAAGGTPGADRPGTADRYVVSVIPSLIGWSALLMPFPIGVWTLIAAFGWILIVDLRATAHGFAPDWYPRLRIPLSGAVMLLLAAGAVVY